jgi:hypothetical protein
MIVQGGNQWKGCRARSGTRAVPLLAGRYPPQDVSPFLRRAGCRATACRAVHKFPVEHTVADATIGARVLRQIPA